MHMFRIVILLAVAMVSLSSVFVVEEGYRGIVIQFGKVQRDAETDAVIIYEPGIHFKTPLFAKTRILEARIQTLDDSPGRFVTGEKKDLIVDYFVKWKIDEFAKFYLATQGNKMNAETLLRSKINNGLRAEFGQRTIQQIVSGQRTELLEEALQQVAESAKTLGVKVLDVRVKQINLPQEISESIYQRMRAERQAVAREHRSEGKEKAEFIKAEVDAKVTVMNAEASRKSLTLRGEGDAEAAKIYADTFNKAPEFYAFYRSLEAYKKSFNNKSDVLVIDPDSDFFNYMKSTELSSKKK